jgi:hypothetical protein
MNNKNKYFSKNAKSVKKADYSYNGFPLKRKESVSQESQLYPDEKKVMDKWKQWGIRQYFDPMLLNYDKKTKQKLFSAPSEPTYRLNRIRTFQSPTSQSNASIMNTYVNNGFKSADTYDTGKLINSIYNLPDYDWKSLYTDKGKNKTYRSITNTKLATNQAQRDMTEAEDILENMQRELGVAFLKDHQIEAGNPLRRANAEFSSSAAYQNMFNPNKNDNRHWTARIINYPNQNQWRINQFMQWMNSPSVKTSQRASQAAKDWLKSKYKSIMMPKDDA